MIEIFPSFMKFINLHIREAQQNSLKTNQGVRLGCMSVIQAFKTLRQEGHEVKAYKQALG